jgi:repressor LexA|tara:strand:+ start:655 stop:894 length:240 start_codon:yes stop_codon:yes gene_type:complete
MITAKQAAVFEFCVDYLATKNYAPSIREIAHATGAKSPSVVFNILQNLEYRKLIRRHPKKHRSIEILRMPNALGGYDDE